MTFLYEKAIGMAAELNQLLAPPLLSNLREGVPPVQCMIWSGKEEHRTIALEVYPFDTIDTIKRMICAHFKDDSSMIPRYTFVGVPVQDGPPSIATEYVPIDYLWYFPDSNRPTHTYQLAHPWKALAEGDSRFVTGDGSYSSPNVEYRGRSTIEDVFLKKGALPVFHVFSLRALLRDFKGAIPLSQEDWNLRFAAYFPDVPSGGPYSPTKEDIQFSKKISLFITKRAHTIDRLNHMIQNGKVSHTMELNGIRYMLLTWKKPIDGFEGAASMFYRIPVTSKRPYMRLIPSERSPITKLHVKNLIPEPTLSNPRVLEGWGKEPSPTPDMDFCTIKYVHRPGVGITQPIYGTIQVLNDGTMNLILQPPKQMKKLHPVLDFHHFQAIINEVWSGLPQPIDSFQLREMAANFTMSVGPTSKRFTKTRLLQRLPMFQTLLKEIKPLPEDNPILSLRYLAVSQYTSEDVLFTFLTQYSSQHRLDGEESRANHLIDALQDEFQLERKEAMDAFKSWISKKGVFTLQSPEEGEFVESFHPGVDIYIYEKHPSYYIHVNRIDSYETYVRIYTILSVLFLESDEYFTVKQDNVLDSIQKEVEEEDTREEEEEDLYADVFSEQSASNRSLVNDMSPSSTASSLFNDPFGSEEVPLEAKAAPAPMVDRTASKTDGPRLVDPTSWFIKKLQEIDPALFQFKTEDDSQLGYSRSCSKNDDRQPAVLTKEQYTRMRKIYENDQALLWIEYPLDGKTEPLEPRENEETITVMRFGSDASTLHYYFCPQYFCLVDEIMIRPSDFDSKKDREGHPKPEQSCPFCHGRLITDDKVAHLGHTVMERKKARNGPQYHQHIRFLGKTTHPDKLALPCCFTSFSKKAHPRSTDDNYAHLRSYFQKEVPMIEEKDEFQHLVYKGNSKSKPYAYLFQTIHQQYILESKKNPERNGFAVASPSFDAFFKQNSAEKITRRVTMELRLRPNAQGFLRFGTEDTIYESLLGILAPLLYKSSIYEVKEHIKTVIIPKVFVSCHFGNLVLEFYHPADGSAMPSTRQELMTWTQRELGMTVTSNNVYALLRIYNAYRRFIRFIDDPKQRKDLRHIQPLLSEPGLLKQDSRGIQLLIMEDNGQEPVTIACPPFGISMEHNRMNDVAFVSRMKKKIASTDVTYSHYELYLHTSNKPPKGAEGEVHETIMLWDYASRRYWPEVVKKRVDEFYTQCQSNYRAMYTSQQGVHPMAMIPMSNAIKTTSYEPEGVVRDSYNHIVAITFRAAPGSTRLVALPVIDDGIVSISSAFTIKNMYLDWEDFSAAPVEEVLSYYRTELEPLFSLYPGYRVKYIARQQVGNKIVAIQLENGLYVPVEESENAASLETMQQTLGIGTVTIRQFEWDINRDIAGIKRDIKETSWASTLERLDATTRCGADEHRTTTYKAWEESYQQFRLMVSNWITSEDATIRQGIETIIFDSNLPEYERRKRLYLYLSSTLHSWFYPDKEHWEKRASFLRKDCRLIDSEESCSGTCYWKQEEGKCLLHVEDVTQLSDTKGERMVRTPELYTKRVIDELVRFPGRRKQLLSKGEISTVTAMIEPVHEGDQYIIPESSPTWTNLLRLDWARNHPEEKKFYEEMSRMADEKNERVLEGTFPDALVPILGKDSPLRLAVLAPSESSLLPLTSILGLTLGELALAPDASIMTKESLRRYVKRTVQPIGMINLTGVVAEGEKTIQFVRPSTGVFSSVMILVFLPDTIGILKEEEGVPTLSIASLPAVLQTAWKGASMLLPSKREPSEEPIKIPIVVQQKIRRPRMATVGTKSLQAK